RTLPPISTLFPYTTLFRSATTTRACQAARLLRFPVTWLLLDPRRKPIAICMPWRRMVLRRGPGLYTRVTEEDRPHEIKRNFALRSEEHTSELQSRENLVCR